MSIVGFPKSGHIHRINNDIVFLLYTEIIAHPQDKLVPVNSAVNLICTSSLSSDVTFSWTHNGMPIVGSSTNDSSILTITSVGDSDSGSYVCTVSSGSVSMTSNTATLTVYGKTASFIRYICNVLFCRSTENYRSPRWW